MVVFRFILSGVTLAALAACGGGGGDSAAASPGSTNTATALQLTGSNYTGAVQESLSSGQALTNGSTVVTGAETTQDTLPMQFALAQLPGLPGRFQSANAVVTGATLSASESCSGGGSLTYSLNDANNNNDLDVGESIAINAVNCAFNGGSMNGGVGYTVTSLSGNLDTYVYALGVTLTFSNLTASTSAGSVGMNGALTLSMQSTARYTNTMTMSASGGLAMSGSYGGVAYSRVLNGFSETMATTPSGTVFATSTTLNGTLSSSNFSNQTLVATTVTPFVQIYPRTSPGSGQLHLSGANGSQARATVRSDGTVLLEVDAAGDGVFETSTTRAWSSLL